MYCAVVLDTFSRRVVGWSIDPAKRLAGARPPKPSTNTYTRYNKPVLRPPIESSQFTSWAFADRAKRSGLIPSMGSIGDCYDNAVIESFLGQNANRATQPQTLEDTDRTGQRDLRLPGGLPQPPTPPFLPRDAHSDRVRTAPPIRPTRGLKPSIGDTTEPRAHQSLRTHRDASISCQEVGGTGCAAARVRYSCRVMIALQRTHDLLGGAAFLRGVGRRRPWLVRGCACGR